MRPETTNHGPPHVHIERLTVARGGRLLIQDLNLSIPRGQFIAVMGPSGVGKSTLLETLAGLRSPAQGSITYCCRHRCLHDPTAFRRRVGLVFQQLHLARNATALHNVLAGALPRHPWWRTLIGFPAAERALAGHCLAALELGAHGQQLVRRLSGGEQQRVALARALVQQPELILADEPVSQLDTALARQVLTLLKNETQQQARTIVCVLHDPALVDRFADAVLTLENGDRPRWRWETTP